MRIGAHVDSDDPLTAAGARGADAVQFFLADPQDWAAPREHPRADALRQAAASGQMELYVHSPYVMNIASTNNRIRIPSRKLLAQHAEAAAAVGAAGLIVHGGHVTAADDPDAGYVNWRKAFEYAAKSGGFPLPILIENTAGGNHACARRFDALARLWDAIGDYRPGFCLDTCHAYCGGEELAGIVERVRAITGTVNLVHANGTRDDFDSGRDRHANFADSQLDPELIAQVIGAAGTTAIVETPAAGQATDIEFLRKRLVHE